MFFLDMDRLVAATDFAARKHKDQRRKDSDQTPYINHPIGVAQILSKEGSVTDVDVLIGALLHDTVEDTECSFEEIEKEFGSRVKSIVAEVTDDKNLEKMERKRLQVEVYNYFECFDFHMSRVASENFLFSILHPKRFFYFFFDLLMCDF